MLLRVAIGWHFLYEAVDKIDSTRLGKKPFSAEAYLRNATGPLAPHFRSLVPDVDGRAKLDPARLKARWTAEVDRIAAHYSFDADQRAAAEKILADTVSGAEDWFRGQENVEKVKKYLDKVDQIAAVLADKGASQYQIERAYSDRKASEADRRELMQVVDAWNGAMTEAVVKLARPEQVKTAVIPYQPPRSDLDWINAATMYGMATVGFCLMAGLFTPLAALGGAAYLAMFYFSMPPWPGLPDNPLAEGHYLIVNKNLVELIACLVIASTPSGLWVGFDAVLFGWIDRKRRASELAAAQDTPSGLEPGRAG